LREVAIKGKRIRTRRLEFRITASPLHHPRVGFIVPKYKHSSVERNRLKRRLREIVRQELLTVLPPAVYAVVRALPASYSADYAELALELRQAAIEIAAAI